MKKGIIILSFLCFSGLMMAQEQEVKGAHPYKVEENEHASDKFSHWSLTPHVGFNYFDGDFNSEMKHAIAIPNAGLDLEYSFNPVWGLGLSYMYDMYTVTGKPGADNADTLLNGHMHKAGLYVSMDFMNLFYPKAKKKIFSANAIIGGGYAWYKSTTMYPDLDGRGHTASQTPESMTSYHGQLYLQAGLGLEFNLNRTLALGVRATYNYFINDYIDGRGYSGPNALASKNNDGIVDVTLNMRFKLMAVSKTHMRNISGFGPWEQQQKAVAHDTVIIHHDTVIIRESVQTAATSVIEHDNSIYYYVYFDNNKSDLNDRGLVTIQQVADRMQEDDELYAVVTGYCDNTGSASLNYALGDKRAENVVDELRAEHGIDPSHLYAMGLGKVVGRRSTAAYGPNRRAAIRLVDKETFDRMKAELDDKHANRPEQTQSQNQTPVQTLSLSETARHEKVNEYKQRSSEKVVTGKSTTLSKLARKYYNNTYCWVYIYIANMDHLKNPNDLKPGTELIIPELTEKETRIHKDASLVLYNNARSGKR